MVPSQRFVLLPAPVDSIKTASLSSMPLSFMTRAFAFNLEPDDAAQGQHLLGPEQGEAARLDQEIEQSGHWRRLPDRTRNVFAADGSPIVKRQATAPSDHRDKTRQNWTGRSYKANQASQVGTLIVAVNLEQIDLVGRGVVAHVVRGHSLDADRETKSHHGNDNPGPFAAIQDEPADEPVERNHGEQVSQDYPHDEL